MRDELSLSSRSAWRKATGFALLALFCGVSLGGLSAWFLGSVAIAGLSTAALTFNFHVPGALVRLFAVGRTAARYGERLTGHKASLADQVAHRATLFAGMAASPATRRAGWQLGDEARLTDYLDDVEDLDYARLRARLPLLALGAGVVGLLLATAFAAPLALAPILLLVGATLLAARHLAKTAAAALARIRLSRRDGAKALGAALASTVALRGETAWEQQCASALARFNEADGMAQALRRRQSGIDALGALLGPLAGLSVIGTAWLDGARGASLLLPVFVAFAWIALGEAATGLSRIVVAEQRRKAAAAEIGQWMAAAVPPAPPASPRPLRFLLHETLQRHAPNGRPIGQPLALRLQAGRPTVLVGESGSGKTSLLKQIAGWTGDETVLSDAGPLSAPECAALSALCLHDAAVLADTVRANLFAPCASDTELRAALEAVELGARLLEGGTLDGWITQDRLSLGEAQRLNLARAWLSNRPVVLLDEPTEHLDEEQGRRILARLLQRHRDRVVVLSSHRFTALPNAATIRLRCS